MEKAFLPVLLAVFVLLVSSGCVQNQPPIEDFSIANNSSLGQPMQGGQQAQGQPMQGQPFEPNTTPMQPSYGQPPNAASGNIPSGGMPGGLGQPMPEPPQGYGQPPGAMPQPPGQGQIGMPPPGQNMPGQKMYDQNLPLPEPPENIIAGENISKNLGSVEVEYFSNAIARGMMESGTDYFITLKNNGNEKEKICFLQYEELRKFVPEWNLHFFEMQDSPIELGVGEQKKLWYFASLDQPGTFSVEFKLWRCGNEAGAITLPVVFGSTDEQFFGNETSYIFGTVLDEAGIPVANAQVDAQINCGRSNFRGQSDAQGNYLVPVLGAEDIDAIYLGRDNGCAAKDYWVSAEKEGYEYYFAGSIAPTRKNPAKLDIVLKKKTESANYSLAWETKVNDNYGFFWVKPSDDWSVFAASQAKHPPELGKPANFYLLDSNGKILWKQPTQNECWGIDIAKDGSKVVAGCHDGNVYAVSRGGTLLWKYDTGGMVRSACISPDGKTVLSGALNPLYLFDSSSGTKKEFSRKGEWLRNCAFYQDGSGFVVGSREVAGFDANANQKWLDIIGEFPLFMDVDSSKNVYASGKVRTFFSFDADGNLRWTYKIVEPTITAGAATPDGSRIAAGSIGGSVYLFEGNGTLLWRRGVAGSGEFSTVGHNAIAISDDGKRIVAGTDSNCISVYDEFGAILWKKCIEPDATNPELKMGVTNVQISNDKKEIIASYGDNYIRKFRLEE